MMNSDLSNHAFLVEAIACTRGKHMRYGMSLGVAFASFVLASPMLAATCQTAGKPTMGAEPQILVDATCEDPGFSERNFEIDKITETTLAVKSTGQQIPYKQVDGHFNPTQTQATLSSGVSSSPTTVRHGVTWLFPAKQFWHNRFFEAVYPLATSQSYIGDPTFEFTHGGYVVNVRPGSPNVGYRVDAAAAKLAKAYANKLYGNNARIFGYIYGISGGSIQTMGAVEGTTGVWDGAMPTSLATDALSMHSFMWDSLYMMAIPPAQRATIAAAVRPGSTTDIYAGLNPEQHAVLEEFINAGFGRRAIEDGMFVFSLPFYTAGGLASIDPTYEDDFWTKPGYEGVNPPSYLSAAKVDGFATIAAIDRDTNNVPTSITFDPATLPALGSMGSEGLQFYVYAADGKTRTVGVSSNNLSGELKGSTLTLKGANDPAMLHALAVGGKIRINNRFLLALCFYPRHDIVNNGNPAYKQYLNPDGTPKYPQRSVEGWMLNSLSTQGGTLETGKIRFKTFLIENLLDPNSYPYTASFYHSQIVRAIGTAQTEDMIRIYYNDSADHADLFEIKGDNNSFLVGFGGIWLQALADLVDWVEKGVTPAQSTRYSVDEHNQVSVPPEAAERRGIQPVVTLTVNNADHATVGLNQTVTLTGKIEVPPKGGKVLQYDWYLGGSPVQYEPPTVLQTPQALVNITRTVSFSKPGTYELTLRATAQRDGKSDYWTNLQNLARVQIVVQSSSAQFREPPQHSTTTPSIVGFWAGEDMVSPNGDRKATTPDAYYGPSYRGDLTPEVWHVLQDYRIPIYLNVRYGRDFGPLHAGSQSDVVALVRKANSLNIPVIAWVVVPYEQGYWAYQGNAQAMFDAVKAWAEWKKANQLQFDSVALDQEFSWQNLQTFIADVTSRDPQKLSSWMRTNIDPSAQCAAFHTYQELISWAHLHGIGVDAAEAPMVADDLADGNLALQNALQITGSSPGYDQMYLMAYRSASAQSGFDPGSSYLASYYGVMQKYFGSVGQVSIGIPGQNPYNILNPLVDDIRMLVGLGAKQIPIYSLEEMVGAFGAAGIQAVAEAAQYPMQGAELANAIKTRPESERMLRMSQSQDATASDLTVAVTKEHGHPRQPNRWPDGCGSLSVQPLVNSDH